MRYYDCGGYPLCSREVLALPALHALPEAGEVLFGFHRTPDRRSCCRPFGGGSVCG